MVFTLDMFVGQSRLIRTMEPVVISPSMYDRMLEYKACSNVRHTRIYTEIRHLQWYGPNSELRHLALRSIGPQTDSRHGSHGVLNGIMEGLEHNDRSSHLLGWFWAG